MRAENQKPSLTPGFSKTKSDPWLLHVTLPHVGKAPPGRRAEEKGRRFRRGYQFRAGVGGTGYALKRKYGLRRCRYHGKRVFGRWAG